MDPEAREHWRLAAALLRAWQECDADARDAWLAAQEPPPAVAAILHRLIRAQSTPDRRLDLLEHRLQPLSGNALAGVCVGAWELIEEIGRGGMAVVYRAHRTAAGFEQHAAVKLLLRTLRDAPGQQRFGRERQILARLRHPHIAGLIDGGIASDGTPYLVMPLIEGECIDAYCEARSLSPMQRVALLLQVCDAVAQAHRQLVVHRDLKPGNILVDRNGHAMLLDFGIARLLDDSSGEHTLTYAFTPGYAAPEQRRGDATVGTGIDIYGVAAVAHRLLAGAVPRHDADGDPRPPSESAALRGDRAAQRHLRGDLDAILMQALADDPKRRHASIDAFADDLRAWLEHRPVAARPPRLAYRLGKLLRRRTGLAATAFLLLLTLAAGVAATAWQARRAMQQAERAERVLAFLDDAMRELVPAVPSAAAQADRQAMLDRLMQQARVQFHAQPRAHADVLKRLADLYADIGAIDRAAQATDEAVTRLQAHASAGDADLASLHANAAFFSFRQGSADAATIDARFLQAIDALADAGARKDLARARIRYAAVLADASRLDASMQQLRQAQAIAVDIGDIDLQDTLDAQIGNQLRNFGAPADALHFHRQWLERARARHGAEHETVANALIGLGHALSMAGQREEGADTLVEGLDLLDRIYPEGNHATVNALGPAVHVLERAGRLDRAHASGLRHLEQAQSLFGERHLQVASALVGLARLQLLRGQPDDAARMLRVAVDVFIEHHGRDSDFVAGARQNLAGALSHQGRHAEALVERTEAMRIAGQVLGVDSQQYASILFGRAGDFENLGRLDEAIRDYRSVLATHIEQQERGGGTERAQIGLASALRRNGVVDEARRLADTAIETLRGRPDASPRTLVTALLVRAEIACAAEPAPSCRQWVGQTRIHALALDPPPGALVRERIAALPD